MYQIINNYYDTTVACQAGKYAITQHFSMLPNYTITITIKKEKLIIKFKMLFLITTIKHTITLKRNKFQLFSNSVIGTGS